MDLYERQARAYRDRQDKIDFQNWLLTNLPNDEQNALANLKDQIALSVNPYPFDVTDSFHLLLRPTFEGITSFNDFTKKILTLPKRTDIVTGKTTRKPTDREQREYALNLYRATVQYRYFQAKKRIYGDWEATTGGLYEFFRQRYPYLSTPEKETIMATLPIIAHDLAKNDAGIAFSGQGVSHASIGDYIAKRREAIQEQCKNIAMKQQMGFWSAFLARIKKTFTLGASALTFLAALFIVPVAVVNPAFEGAWALYTLGAMAMLYPLWRFFFRSPNYYHEDDNLFYEPTEVTYSAKITQAYDRQHWFAQLLIVLVGLATIAGLAYESRDFLTGVWSPKDIFALSSSSGYIAPVLAYLPLLAAAIFIGAAIYIINQNPAEIPAAPLASLSVPNKGAIPRPSLSQANPSLLAQSSTPIVSSSSQSQASTSALPSAPSADGSGIPIINIAQTSVRAEQPLRT